MNDSQNDKHKRQIWTTDKTINMNDRQNDKYKRQIWTTNKTTNMNDRQKSWRTGSNRRLYTWDECLYSGIWTHCNQWACAHMPGISKRFSSRLSMAGPKGHPRISPIWFWTNVDVQPHWPGAPSPPTSVVDPIRGTTYPAVAQGPQTWAKALFQDECNDLPYNRSKPTFSSSFLIATFQVNGARQKSRRAGSQLVSWLVASLICFMLDSFFVHVPAGLQSHDLCLAPQVCCFATGFLVHGQTRRQM